MDPREQVLFVLQVVMALGPIAIYFLGLGLANSQARPFLMSARRDFTLLASAFIPLILVPALALAQQGHGRVAAGAVFAVTALFVAMLPGRGGSWVVYNVGAGQLRRLLERACRRQGWRSRVDGGEMVVEPGGLRVGLNQISWLRNATLDLACIQDQSLRDQLLGAFREELSRESMLPSPTGASLVVIGASLLGLPMWYLFHNMDLIVDVVRQILFA